MSSGGAMEAFDSSDNRVRCPQCGTLRLRVRAKPDRIDRLQGNRFLNNMRAKRGDTLYHCIYCRLQFYDARKPMAEESPEGGDSGASAPPNPADTSEPELAAPAKNPATAATVPDGSNLGPAVRVLGAIQTAEDLYVEGCVQGTVESDGHRITIGSRGKMEATVQAHELEVQGELYGDARVVQRTILRSGSSVVGNISCGGLVIEDGAYFKGSVELTRVVQKTE